MTGRFAALIAAFCLLLTPCWAATFLVNSAADEVDASPGDGICATSHSTCTLRAAVQEAGAFSGAHTIVLPAGSYTLSATPACSYQLVSNPAVVTENMSALCVKGKVTINGAGADSTIIDAGGAGGATCCGSYPSARGMAISLGAIVKLSGVTIHNGLSNGGFTWFGGGAINNQGTLDISYCVLTGNNGIPGGAGLWNDGTLVADNVSFSGNTAGGGGGLYNDAAGKAQVSNSTFNLNQANGGGGGAIANFGALKILSSTLSNNTSTANGGAISNDSGSVALTNVTIASNQGFTGGAIWNDQFGSVTVNNSTITLNQAANHTGGVSNGNSFVVSNSIIGGNFDSANPSAQTDCEGPITSQGHNLISGITGTCRITGSTSSDIYAVPTGLGSLAPNGGSTQTLALTSTSKALDAGDPSAPGTGGTSCAAADQRGFLRPQNGRCDMGAFELSSSLSVAGITPSHAGNTSIAEGVIFGGGMSAGASVKLRKSGQADIVGTQVGVQDGNSSLGAEFDLTGKATGAWDVVVANPDGSVSSLPGAFTIDSGGSAIVWAEVGGAAFVRAGTTATYYFLFGNRGNVDALEVPVTLAVPTEIALAINFGVQPPPAQPGQVPTDWSQVPVYVTPLPVNGFVNVPLILPIIPAGYTGALRFAVSIPNTLVHGESFQLYVSNGDPLLQVGADPSALVNQLAAGAVDYAQESLGVTIPSSENGLLNQYIANQVQNSVAAARAQFSATSGTSPLIYSLGQLNIDAAEFAAANASSGNTAKITFAKGLKPRDSGAPSNQVTCSTPDGKIFSLAVGDVQPGGSSCADPEIFIPPPPCAGPQKSTQANPCLDPDTTHPLTPTQCRDLPKHHVNRGGTMCLPNAGSGCSTLAGNPVQGSDPICAPVPIKSSVDPNAKSGPFGPGAQQFHTSGTAYDYNVEFENQPTASLPAQQVVVTDNLDTSNLDLSTFSLGPISFGSYTLTPPGGAQQFSGGIALRPDLNLIVKVDAGLNLSTGVVTWRFTSLDPDTEQFTTDPAAGFLPPNVTPPQGEGRLFYTIRPKPGITSGTVVCNQATVVFDTNPAINTQNWCNTVDDTLPSSSVSKLPASEASGNFLVEWSGTDTGSGIHDYSIYVSDNGGAFNPWLSNTTDTSATYTGVADHTYGFYSIARDSVGNGEGAKSAAETTTTVTGATVSTTTIASDVAATFSPAAQSVQLKATVTGGQTMVNGGSVTFALLGLQVSGAVSSGAATANFPIPGGTAAGQYSISATYNPAPGFSGSGDSTKQLTLSQATPAITWANPADIPFGNALGSTQLNATANVPGSFAYTPAAGTVLHTGNGQLLTTTFSPADAVDYAAAAKSVSVNVKAPTPGGPAQLLITRSLTRDSKTNNVVIAATIANIGGAAAANVQITSAKIGTTNASTALPLSIGVINSGNFSQASISFPGSAGAPGTATTVTIAGTYTGGSFTSTARVNLP